jgi:hypothetical protein
MLSLEWRIMTDQLGSDLRRFDPSNRWTLFSQSALAKRWERHERGLIANSCDWAREVVERRGADERPSELLGSRTETRSFAACRRRRPPPARARRL